MSAIPRNENESFEDYKVRREADHRATKKARAGKLFHDSYYEGTYQNLEKASPEKFSKKALKNLKRKGNK